MTTSVLINGAHGRMGTLTTHTLEQSSDFHIAARCGRQDHLATMIQTHHPDIVIDFTLPDVVFDNTHIILDNGARPLIGTSGLSSEQVKILTDKAADKKCGGMIVPNFSIGVTLMMKLSQMAARYFPNVEIIEMHHNNKVDSPSGTAIKTAEGIADTRKAIPERIKEHENLPHARGANCHDIPIHSVRLPGLVAHQSIIFGGHAETLTLKHDTLSREAFSEGILLACRHVMTIDEMQYGLEHCF